MIYSLLLVAASGYASGQTCPAGQYVNGGACDPCPTGKYSAGGTVTKCETCPGTTDGVTCNCPIDHRVDANNDCVACAANSYRAAGDDTAGSETQCAAASSTGAGSCQNDISTIACRGFETAADFEVENVANSPDTYQFKALLMYNRAYQTVTDTPWDKTADLTPTAVSTEFTQGTLSGCVYTSHNGNTVGNPYVLQVGDKFTCSGSVETECFEVTDGQSTEHRDGRINAVNQITLQNLVSALNNAGAFELYFQRIQENPIAGAGLKWLAQNACKVTVPVSFECTGANCVEVQNIVCASFAGIDSDNYGVVSIECKVPPNFVIHNAVVGNGANGGATTDPSPISNTFNVDNTNAVHFSNGALDGLLATGSASTQACSSGQCQITFKSNAVIPAPTTTTVGNIAGSIKIEADVKSLQMNPPRWTGQLNEFHVAKYNLTRASAPEKVLTMPIGVNFYSDQCDQTSLAASNQAAEPAGCELPAGQSYPLNTIAAVSAKFPTSIDSVPFLARQDVNLGSLRKHVHGYLRMVAKVNARSSWFLSREITKYELSTSLDSAGAIVWTDKTSEVTTGGASPCTYVGSAYPTAASGSGAATNYHTSAGYPVSYMKCDTIMEGVQAGNVMRFSLKWQLGAISSSSTALSGKAVLLQDAPEADPNSQSVEVRLTIQLGGGETNITTGGTDGTGASVGGTLMYIIIAVAVIAAALVLAVVVVGFMCLRSKTQEQIVSMSPQKCTVAAVYDISVPKKADAMDV